ncbi:MAG: hypothetical protein U9Q80_05875 [Bacillota bacterium]|nr:hypothetical protein [Bacillota bacterium]
MKEIQNNHLNFSFQTDLIYYHLQSMKPLFRSYHNTYASIEFDDAFNELYIQIHTSIHNLKCLESFNKWCLKIFILHSKKIKFELPLYDCIPIEDFSVNILRQRCIKNVLDTLKDIEKEIIIDNLINDIPLLEIAKKQDLSYANTRIIKHRALKKIKFTANLTSLN